jgi:adenylosuccinate lyase
MKPLSPLDDRYFGVVKPLVEFFSEDAITRQQMFVEQEYLKALLSELKISSNLKRFLAPITEKDINIIKQIETKGYKGIPATNHDLKAIEYFLKGRVDSGVKEFVHFGLTSDDVKNIALGLALKGALEKHIIPRCAELASALSVFARGSKGMVMLARTHGQAASVTTLGKEVLVFQKRLEAELELLKQGRVCGKLSGSVGTYSALKFAYPDVDWVGFSRRFVEGLGLEHVAVTTQILPPESYIRVFQGLQRINNILISFCQDMWRYISDDWLKQRAVRGEVGSSVMPQKVNPIDFENAEGNLKLANGIIEVFVRELPISRLQRDLSDSTIKRNFGVALGHSYLAYTSCAKGLSKLEPNEMAMLDAVRLHPEILAEGIQTELRKTGLPGYELLKELTRGRRICPLDIRRFIDELRLPDSKKRKLKGLKAEEYLGEISRLFS